jgi:hypothetical protein
MMGVFDRKKSDFITRYANASGDAKASIGEEIKALGGTADGTSARFKTTTEMTAKFAANDALSMIKSVWGSASNQNSVQSAYSKIAQTLGVGVDDAIGYADIINKVGLDPITGQISMDEGARKRIEANVGGKAMLEKFDKNPALFEQMNVNMANLRGAFAESGMGAMFNAAGSAVGLGKLDFAAQRKQQLEDSAANTKRVVSSKERTLQALMGGKISPTDISALKASLELSDDADKAINEFMGKWGTLDETKKRQFQSSITERANLESELAGVDTLTTEGKTKQEGLQGKLDVLKKKQAGDIGMDMKAWEDFYSAAGNKNTGTGGLLSGAYQRNNMAPQKVVLDGGTLNVVITDAATGTERKGTGTVAPKTGAAAQ